MSEPTQPDPVARQVEAAPVLAYATPMSRRQISKPLRMRIIYAPGPDGPQFTEVSDEKGWALAAMIWCGFTMLLLGRNLLAAVDAYSRSGGRLFEVLIVGLLLVVQATVMTLVFNQTWRRTLLAVRDGMLLLQVKAPIGSWRRQWPLAEVLHIHPLILSHAGGGSEPLCELQVQVSGEPAISVFRNYGRRELDWVASSLARSIPSQ
jgi:hypothetical protein